MAEEAGRLDIDGRYGTPVLNGYVGLVCNLNPQEVDPKRLTGEILNDREVHAMLRLLEEKEGVPVAAVLRNIGFVDGRAEIGIRDERFDKFFSNDNLEIAEKIAEEIFTEIQAIIEQEKLGSMSRTSAVGADGLLGKSLPSSRNMGFS